MSLYFTREHEWIRVDGNSATVGISDHAQEALGDIVFVEVPSSGRELRRGEEAAVVESVKAASDVYSPISGSVIEGNQAIADDPAEMVEAARANGVDAVLLDAADMQFFSEFDAAFSNATMHWVLDKERAARAIFRALKRGGRFAGEMGGEGNIRRLREALDEELIIRGYVPAAEAANWYASPEAFASVYEAAGFAEIDARLIERPTPIEHGVAAWVTTFRRGWLDRAVVPEQEREEIAAAVADRIGSNVADYIRLRLPMLRP